MKFIYVFMFTLLPFFLEAEDKSYFSKKLSPHYTRVQVAGNLGMVALGFGYKTYQEKFDVGFLYGYLPKKIGGSSIHTTALKITLTPWTINTKPKFTLSPYLRSGLHVGLGHSYDLFIEDRFRDYYWPSALTIPMAMGLKTGFTLGPQNRLKKIEFDFAAETIMPHALNFGLEEGILLRDIISLSLGIDFVFKL